jgi:hypothetical protein
MLVLLGVVLTLVLEAAKVEMAALPPPGNAGVPRSVIVFGGSGRAGAVKARVIMCVLNRLFTATGAPGRPNAVIHPAL